MKEPKNSHKINATLRYAINIHLCPTLPSFCTQFPVIPRFTKREWHMFDRAKLGRTLCLPSVFLLFTLMHLSCRGKPNITTTTTKPTTWVGGSSLVGGKESTSGFAYSRWCQFPVSAGNGLVRSRH